ALDHRYRRLRRHVARGEAQPPVVNTTSASSASHHVMSVATMRDVSSGTIARAVIVAPRCVAQAAMVSPDTSARSPFEPASDMVRIAIRMRAPRALAEDGTAGAARAAASRSPDD